MPQTNPYAFATPWASPSGWRHFTIAEKRGGQNPEMTWNTYPTQGASLIPSSYDPRSLLAGRQTPGSSMSSNSRPQGLLWQSAANWVSRMPALVGR